MWFTLWSRKPVDRAAEIVRCYACGKDRHESVLLIRVRDTVICDDCIQLCSALARARIVDASWERLREFAP